MQAGSAKAITAAVKADLEDVLGGHRLTLPEGFMTPRPDCYARRLLHRDPQGRYSAIVMTWGPGQGTAVHDHGGLWCVEGVVDGEIAVTQYLVQPDQARLLPCHANRITAGWNRIRGLPDSPDGSSRAGQRASGESVGDAACVRR